MPHHFTLKASYDGKLRKMNIQPETTFKDFLKVFGLENAQVALYYHDQDGDEIVVDSEIGWNVLKEEGLESLKCELRLIGGEKVTERVTEKVAEKVVVEEEKPVEAKSTKQPVYPDPDDTPNSTPLPTSTPPKKGDQGWLGIQCDNCGDQNFHGARFKCTECSNYDLCSSCFTLQQDEVMGKFHNHRFLNMGLAPPRNAASIAEALLPGFGERLVKALSRPSSPTEEGWIVENAVGKEELKKEEVKKEPITFSQVMENLASALGSVKAFPQDENVVPQPHSVPVEPVTTPTTPQLPGWLEALQRSMQNPQDTPPTNPTIPPWLQAIQSRMNQSGNPGASSTTGGVPQNAPWWLPMVSQAIQNTDWQSVLQNVQQGGVQYAQEAASRAAAYAQEAMGHASEAAGAAGASSTAASSTGGGMESLKQLYEAYQQHVRSNGTSQEQATEQVVSQDEPSSETVQDSTGRNVPPPPQQDMPQPIPQAILDMLSRVGRDVGRDTF